MTTKPEVKRYKLESGHDSMMRRVNRMQESEGGVYVRFDDYEALQAECKRLQAAHEEEIFCVRQDRDTHFGEMMRAIEQVDALQAECEKLRTALAESRANDLTAMAYLNQIRQLVGGDDFPDMVRRCEKLCKVADQYRRLIELGEDFQWENIIRVEISDFPSRADAIDAAMQEASHDN